MKPLIKLVSVYIIFEKLLFSFEKLSFFSLETVLLSEVVDPDENLFKESFADLDTRYLFSETLPDYFQNTRFLYLIFEYLKFTKTFR